MAPLPLSRIVVNLLALIALGLGICAWVLYYTEAFPEVLGLLSLGGLFAWSAFLANLLTKERKEELQQWFEENVLASGTVLFGLAVLGLAFALIWAPIRGSLIVSTKREDSDRTIEIRSRSQDGEWSDVVIEEEHLAPHSENRFALPTSWFGSREYRIKISGLPAKLVRVESWRRKPIYVPADFGWAGKRAVLVHPSAVLAANAQKTGGVLQVKPLGTITEYRGETIWVGCEDDVEIPPPLLQRWRQEASPQSDREQIVARWELRRSIAPYTDLVPNQRLRISYVNPVGGELSTKVTVRSPFPQEVILDVPH